MKGFKNKICKACSEEPRSRDRHKEVARRGSSSNRECAMRGTSTDRERVDPRPNKEAPTAGCWVPGCPTQAISATVSSSDPAGTGEMGKRPVVLTSRDGASISSTVRAGASSTEAPALQHYSDRRMTKLICATNSTMRRSCSVKTSNGPQLWPKRGVIDARQKNATSGPGGPGSHGLVRGDMATSRRGIR